MTKIFYNQLNERGPRDSSPLNWSLFIFFYGLYFHFKGQARNNTLTESSNNWIISPMEARITRYNAPLYKRSFNSWIRKTSKGATAVARSIIKAMFPVTKSYGPTAMIDRMVKKHNIPRLMKRQILDESDRPKPNFRRNSLQTRQYSNYYPYPAYVYPTYAYIYPPTYGYNVLMTPYVNNPADFTKRMAFPYQRYQATQLYDVHAKGWNGNSKGPYFQYQYPYEMARLTSDLQQRTNIESPQTQAAEAMHTREPTSTSAVAQSLYDLEIDMEGFNQAVQYMKEVVIAKNHDGVSEFNEKLYDSGSNINVEKKNTIQKQEPLKQTLSEAFKRTIKSRENLENKLVNYFTNYVCGKDC